MERKFKLIKDYYDDGDIYNKSSITILDGLTVLVGCNGTGKSTLIQQIKDSLEKEKTPYISYDNLHDGGYNARSKAGFYGDFNFLASTLQSSEGENIMLNIGKFATSIGNFVKKQVDKKSTEIWILLDAFDSGFSIDNIIDVKRNLFDTILEDCKSKGITTYIVVAANSYELANGEQCFDVYRGKYIKFKDYEDYKKFILESGKLKYNRYKDH